MAKLSKRQKFLRKSSSSSGKSWQFNEQQLNQIESLYGANVRNIYEPEETPPQQLGSKRRNFLAGRGRLSDYTAARLGRGCDEIVLYIPPGGAGNLDLIRYDHNTQTHTTMSGPGPVNSTDIAMWGNKIYQVHSTPRPPYAEIWEYEADYTTNTYTLLGTKEIISSIPPGYWQSNSYTMKDANTIIIYSLSASSPELGLFDISTSTATQIGSTISLSTNPAGDIAYDPTSDTFVVGGYGQPDGIVHYDMQGNFLGSVPGYTTRGMYKFNGEIYAECEGTNDGIRKVTLNPLSVGPVLDTHPYPNGAQGFMAADSTCPPARWNCTISGCIDPGDGSGQYTSLHACNDACTNYECVVTSIPTPGLPTQQTCVPRIGPLPGGATPYLPLNYYTTLADCQAGCQDIRAIPPDTWDCEFDIDPLGNTPPSYYCIQKYDGSGQYNSLAACQAVCRGVRQPPRESYDCDDNYNCYDPGTGLGQYPTLLACQIACKPGDSPRPTPLPRGPGDTRY